MINLFLPVSANHIEYSWEDDENHPANIEGGLFYQKVEFAINDDVLTSFKYKNISKVHSRDGMPFTCSLVFPSENSLMGLKSAPNYQIISFFTEVNSADEGVPPQYVENPDKIYITPNNFTKNSYIITFSDINAGLKYRLCGMNSHVPKEIIIYDDPKKILITW